MSSKQVTTLSGWIGMKNRLRLEGGFPQQDRMIHDKRWSLQHALKYSYQAAKVRLIDHEEICPALINPDKVKQNYDDKIISIEYDYGFKPGDVFEWLNTDTLWLVTLQELTELAYFRSEIRRCNYIIKWINQQSQEEFEIHAAIRGPVETKINYIQKSGDSVDIPNHSLSILMPKNKETLLYFRRYAKFYLSGLDDGDKNTCYRVEAVDSISMPGVLEVIADEYYANVFEDDEDNKLAHGLVIAPEKPENAENNFISGQGLIHPHEDVEYMYRGQEVLEWTWDKTLPLKVTVDGRTLTLRWLKAYGGKFTIKCGEVEKEIRVDSLF